MERDTCPPRKEVRVEQKKLRPFDKAADELRLSRDEGPCSLSVELASARVELRGNERRLPRRFEERDPCGLPLDANRSHVVDERVRDHVAVVRIASPCDPDVVGLIGAEAREETAALPNRHAVGAVTALEADFAPGTGPHQIQSEAEAKPRGADERES